MITVHGSSSVGGHDCHPQVVGRHRLLSIKLSDYGYAFGLTATGHLWTPITLKRARFTLSRTMCSGRRGYEATLAVIDEHFPIQHVQSALQLSSTSRVWPTISTVVRVDGHRWIGAS